MVKSRNKNENKIKIINLEVLYLNSFQKFKYLPECTNIDIKASPNEILSIHKSDVNIATFKSFIFKDMNSNIRKNNNNNNKNDFIKIPKVILIG